MKNYLLCTVITLCSANPVHAMNCLFPWISQQKSPVAATKPKEAAQLKKSMEFEKNRRIDEGNAIGEIQSFLPLQNNSEKIESYSHIAQILERQLQDDVLSYNKRTSKTIQLQLTKKMITNLKKND